MKHTQFMHTQSYGLFSPGKKASVTGVVGELLRIPSYCRHVSEPMDPTIHYGRDIKGTAKLLRSMVKKHNDTKGNRKLLPHAQLMVGTIVSYPITDLSDTAEFIAYQHWVKCNIKWAQQEYKHQLHAIVEHRDESHYHMHIIAIACFKHGILGLHGIHPGQYAERGLEPKKRIPAYKRAMRAMQDRYWQAVGLLCGFLRISDKPSFRLTYGRWKKDKLAKEKLNEEEKRRQAHESVYTPPGHPSHAAPVWSLPGVRHSVPHRPTPK